MKTIYYNFCVVVTLAIISLCTHAKNVEPLYKYYIVEGHDFNSLDASIKKNRPNGYNSMNESHIGWQFNFKHKNGKCYLIEPRVNNKVIITLPKWIKQQDAPTKLVNEWQRYIKALQVHQLGHINFSYKSQQAILNAFKDIKAEKKCDTLKVKANKLAKSIVNKFDLQEKKYERRTKKGLTQGAILHQP